VIQEAESWEELCALEVAAIKSHRTKGPHGYNMTSGGDGVPDISGAAKERHRRKSSAAAKKAWAGEMRDKRAETFRSEVFKERHRQATSIGTAKAYQDPAVRAKLSMSRQNPDYRAKVSGSVKALWDNPDYRARQVAIRRGRPSGRSEESLKRQSELMKSIIAERKAAGTYWN
jgi:hypothetical protein